MSTDGDIREIKSDIKKILVNLGELKYHVQNEAIHQLPPCDFHRSLSARLWAIAFTSVSALVAAIYNMQKHQ